MSLKRFFGGFFCLAALLTFTAVAVKNRGGLCIRSRSKLKLRVIYLFLKRSSLYGLPLSYTSMQMTAFSIFVSALKAPWCVQSADVRSFSIC